MAPTVRVSSIATNADIDTRYSDLLNPIRDLTKNWEVNIAAHLEEFLSELEGIAISFSNGTPSLNFARAALLIQGSTTVYCKKVEYLCTLCQKMRHIISDERKTQRSDSEAPKEKEVATGASDEFLSLDNIKEHKNLELTDDGNDDVYRRVSILPLTPIVLIPLEDREKGDVLLISASGDLIGRKRDFHLNICHLGISGALLLPMSHSSDPEEFIREDTPNCSSSSEDRLPMSCPEVDPLPASCLEDTEDIENERHDCSSPIVEADELIVDDNDDSFAESHPPSPLEQPVCCNNVEDIGHSQKRRSSRIATKIQDKIEKEKNLWKSSTFNEALIKPIKKKKTRKMAVAMKHGTRKSKSNNSKTKTLLHNPLNSCEEYCSRAFYSHSSKFPKNAMKTPEISVFENLYWEQSKKDKDYLKTCQRNMNDFDENQQEEEGDEVLNCYAPDSDDDGNNDPFSEGSELAPEESPCLQPAAEFEEQIPVVPTFTELARRNMDAYLQSLNEYCITTDLSVKVSQWEDRIKPILENENKREIFDIHLYEKKIMDKFCDNNRKQSLSFSNICMKKEKWEVCRYFLASLQLANNYNLNISENEAFESSEDFELTLLSRKKQFGDDTYDPRENND